MKEIEVKILEINRKNMEEKLISLGARKVFDDSMYMIFFDDKEGSVRAAHNSLRLRKEGKDTTLTFKKFVTNQRVKIREEQEVSVCSFETTKNIMESIGLNVWLELKKNRVSYVFKDARMEFDKYIEDYDFIPEFMEIEAKDEQTIFKYAKLLGIEPERCSTIRWHKLVEKYKKK